jgi:fructose-1,6-bisphosphatase I / sedoheptulose-1,7-bisphosphatase
MVTERMTLSRFLAAQAQSHGDASGELSTIVLDVATACRQIAETVRAGALGKASDAALSFNSQGEPQAPLDIVANDIFLRANETSGRVAAMVSEEMEAPFAVSMDSGKAKYLLAFYPLDGSSNIDVNVAIGSIFSVLRADAAEDADLTTAFLQPGCRQVCAGYAIYGPATMLVLTLGAGVHGFTLEPQLGMFFLTHPSLTISPSASEFAINVSNCRFWEAPVKRYIDECLAGNAGPRGRDFNMRSIASLVAEVHRILMRGGVFLYPRDRKDPTKPGRLRLLYEANPVSFIVEQAGGRSISGCDRILDITPSELHQRIGLIFGAAEDIDRIAAYHREERLPQEDAPLFASRGLFRTSA